MTDNPFEALGGSGGFDLEGLLQQAQQMQQQLEGAQQRLIEARVEGTVAGGAVCVVLNGIGELQEVRIKPGGFDASSADDLADLGDLVVAAYRDAKAQADNLAGSALGPLSGGVPGLGGAAPDQGGPDEGPGEGPDDGPRSLGFGQEG
jgi:nucleoid-associated protein EbfC